MSWGHGDAHQSRVLWLSLCNDLKQCMTMTESNNVSSMWHQRQTQTGQQLGEGVERKCLWITSPVTSFWKVSSRCCVLPSPLQWAFQMTTTTGSPSVPWNGFATPTWICVVWKCGWASTRERESESACECVRMARARATDSAHPCLQKLWASVIEHTRSCTGNLSELPSGQYSPHLLKYLKNCSNYG